MTLGAFQVACAVVLAIAYAIRLAAPAGRDGGRIRRLAVIGILALSAWAGEQSCITLYRFYEYAPGWWGRVVDVPVLVPLIWPLVVLSARDVARELAPGEAPLARAARTAAIVVFDASLMEVVAVAAGFWRWSEPGYLGVPIVGILGWGCFGFGAALWLERAGEKKTAIALGGLPLASLLGTHLLLLATWWGALRWIGRGDLGPRALAGFALVAIAAALAVARARARRRLSLETTISRVVASLVFFALLASLTAPAPVALLWTHVGLVALPYLLAVPLQRVPVKAGGAAAQTT